MIDRGTRLLLITLLFLLACLLRISEKEGVLDQISRRLSAYCANNREWCAPVESLLQYFPGPRALAGLAGASESEDQS